MTYTLSLSFLAGVCSAGNLQLNPNLKRAIRLAGSDNSFFIACIPHSPERQEGRIMFCAHMNCSVRSKLIKDLHKISGVDSRVWAKGLSWNRQLPDSNWEKLDLDRKARYNREETSTYRVTHQDG